jgi:hypothetical protein
MLKHTKTGDNTHVLKEGLGVGATDGTGVVEVGTGVGCWEGDGAGVGTVLPCGKHWL